MTAFEDRVEIEALRGEFKELPVRLQPLDAGADLVRFGEVGDGRDAPAAVRREQGREPVVVPHRRTPDGRRFTERVYEMRYVDETALPGKVSSAPGSAPGGAASSG
ncbi:hypothetical protein [Amycolatopsis thermoflava]|uniref:hypothetical protein n=1 Tax=Amycolatopsis thermoflava TaxID=84480 RepID=UPI003D75A708